MGEIMRAKKTAMITDARGKRRKITKGVTTADGDAQIVQDKPHLWGPLEVDFPAEPVAPDAPVSFKDRVARASAEMPQPTTAKVRKWAQDQGIEVSAKGFIAKDVIESYIAAHS